MWVYMFSYTLSGLGKRLRICSSFIQITKSSKMQISIQKSCENEHAFQQILLFCSLSLKNSQDEKQNQTMMLYYSCLIFLPGML